MHQSGKGAVHTRMTSVGMIVLLPCGTFLCSSEARLAGPFAADNFRRWGAGFLLCPVRFGAAFIVFQFLFCLCSGG